MQKWEYCVILGVGGGQARIPTVREFTAVSPRYCRLTAQGVEMVTGFRNRPNGISEADAVAQLIAQLGDEGWEMVGTGNEATTTHSLYFKRPKP